MADNILQQVETYNDGVQKAVNNYGCYFHTANKKYSNYETAAPQNKGVVTTFDLQPKVAVSDTLIAQFTPVEQRKLSIAVDKEFSASYDFTVQEFIYNVKDYMKKFGKSAGAGIGNKLETYYASLAVTQPFRFYGDGVTKIDSFKQLANALSFFRNYGVVRTDTRGFLYDMMTADIVDSGLSQFVLNRNEKMAFNWELGSFKSCKWFESSVTPIHYSGNVGENGTTLTITSITYKSGPGIPPNTIPDVLICSGAGVDPDAIKQYDRFEFQDGVSGQPDIRYMNFYGQNASASPVQFSAGVPAPSFADEVAVHIGSNLPYGEMRPTDTTVPIAVGMQLKSIPSHRVGLITGGEAMYAATPRLPEERPYDSFSSVDQGTGIGMRTTYGATFGENRRGIIHDGIYGGALIPESSIAIIIPLSQ